MSEQTARERASKWREVADDIADLVFDLEQAEAKLAEARAEIKKLEDEIMDCPADTAYHTSLASTSEGYGRCPDKLPYNLTCERVSVPVPCDTCTLQHRYVERCKYHGCAWPDGEKECPAWKQWVGDCSEDSVP